MTQKINCYQAAFSYVKAFFEAFATGILDGKATDNNKKKQYTPQQVKAQMLVFYPHLNPVFIELVAPVLAKLTYKDAETLAEKLRNTFQHQAPDAKQYLKLVCRTQKLYEAVISEYQRNFALILQGNLNTEDSSC